MKEYVKSWSIFVKIIDSEITAVSKSELMPKSDRFMGKSTLRYRPMKDKRYNKVVRQYFFLKKKNS